LRYEVCNQVKMSKNNSVTTLTIICIVLSVTHWICGALSRPLCSNCKWMIPNKSGSLCGIYKTKYDLLGAKVIVHEYAEHCRKNEWLCGNDGYLYEPSQPIVEHKLNLEHEKDLEHEEDLEEDDDTLRQELEELFNAYDSFYEAIAR